MDKWGTDAKWYFGEVGAQMNGINDAGIGLFKKNPYVGLAKEILQNSLDAKDPSKSGPVKVKFEMTDIKAESFPGRERLLDVINKCYETYGAVDNGGKLKNIQTAAIKYLDGDENIPVLKVSDYNTTGLTGVKEETGSNWTGLVRETGSCNKGNGNSGSFGIGKFAPFNFSSVRTIIYSTLNRDNEIAIQGKTILTSFKEDDTYKENVGLFGVNKRSAIYSYELVPDVFKRNEIGTDLFILAIDKDKEDYEWYHQVIICILEYFFYAIYQGSLEVEVIDGEKQQIISKNNLEEIIKLYDSYCKEKEIDFSVLEFWNVLINKSGEVKKHVTSIENKGEIELYLLVDADNIKDRKVVEMRKAGIKIQEDTGFRIPTGFYGILIATGNNSESDLPEDNISSFLLNCENPAHDVWSKDEYSGHEKEADRILKKIHKWIYQNVHDSMPKVEEETVSAYGLSELLPNQYSAGTGESQQKAFINFKPVPLIVEVSKYKNKKQTRLDISKDNTVDFSVDEELFVSEAEQYFEGETSNKELNDEKNTLPFGSINGVNKVPYSDDGEIMNDSTQLNTNNNKNAKKIKNIHLVNVKTPYDMQNNMYVVSFITNEDYSNVHLRIRTAADDDDKRIAELKKATLGNDDLRIEKGYIILPEVKRNQKNLIKVELMDAGKYLLEVEAYA